MADPMPRARAQRMRLVILDVDGVLTDGGVYLGQGQDGAVLEYKRFEITDSLGIRMLQQAGLPVILVSGRESLASRARAAELGIEVHVGTDGHKLPIVEDLLQRHGVAWEETACVCDDLADLSLLRRAGLAVAVRNAAAEVRATAHWCTRRTGGYGAVREFAEALLKCRGEWHTLVNGYRREREAEAPS